MNEFYQGIVQDKYEHFVNSLNAKSATVCVVKNIFFYYCSKVCFLRDVGLNLLELYDL